MRFLWLRRWVEGGGGACLGREEGVVGWGKGGGLRGGRWGRGGGVVWEDREGGEEGEEKAGEEGGGGRRKRRKRRKRRRGEKRK